MLFNIFVWFAWCLISSTARRSDVGNQKLVAVQTQGPFKAIHQEHNDSITAVGQVEGRFWSMEEANYSMHDGNISSGKPEGVCEEPFVLQNFYEIEKKIGEGTYGNVYKGTSKRSGVKVAIKDIAQVDHFSSLELEPSRHNLPFNSKIIEAFYSRQHKKVDIVYPFYGGGDLHTWIAEHNISAVTPQRIHDIVAQIALGLWRLHLQGYIHRDLKPQNIMTELMQDGRIRKQVITDFGLVQKGCSESNPLCGSGRGGTPTHMGPGQWAGGSYGVGEDWFAFGVIFYQLVTGGSLPFGAGPDVQYYAQQATHGTPDLSMIVDPLMSDLLFKLLSPRGYYATLDKREWFRNHVASHPVLGHAYFYQFSSSSAPRPSARPSAGTARTEGLPMGWTQYPDHGWIYKFSVTGGQSQAPPVPSQSSTLVVLGGLNSEVASILRGTYVMSSTLNQFGKPVYVKDSFSNVDGIQMHQKIYYWETPTHRGWWFGSPDNNVFWAFNADYGSPTPPASGWVVPFVSGMLDATFQIMFAVQQSSPSHPSQIVVSGGTDASHDAILRGVYSISQYRIHGRPIYKKNDRVEIEGVDKYIRIYYHIDGATAGWWFGTDIGGIKVLGYNDQTLEGPPSIGWRVPFNAQVDETLQIQGPKQYFWNKLCLTFNGDDDGGRSCDLRNIGRTPMLPLCRRQ